MGVNKKIIESIAEHLPEGLSETTLEKIALLLSETVKQRVQEAKDDLTSKVTFFIRGNIDKLKEQAKKELELDNEVYRNAQMFETVRAMFAVENTAEDEQTGMSILASLGESLEQKNEALLGQTNKLLKENIKFKSQLKVLSDKNVRLEESLNEVSDELELLNESGGERNFSDKAFVANQDNFDVEESGAKKTDRHTSINEWIDQSVLDKLPKLGK